VVELASFAPRLTPVEDSCKIAEEDVSGLLHYTKLGEFVPKPNVSFWTLRAMLV
jgi:hypothetical protein